MISKFLHLKRQNYKIEDSNGMEWNANKNERQEIIEINSKWNEDK